MTAKTDATTSTEEPIYEVSGEYRVIRVAPDHLEPSTRLLANEVPVAIEFNGEVYWVQIDLEQDDHDHLISPEERFQVAMARQ